MFKKQEKPLIHVYTHLKTLTKVEEVQPKPAFNFVPDWWKKMPVQKPYPEVQTVKMCPSFPEYFSQGIVIPMWADTTIKYDELTDSWTWTMGTPGQTNPFDLSIHDKPQFLNHVSVKTQGIKGTFIFKFHCPWRLRTPKGYSVLQLPLFYHFNQEFSVLPGIIHTDFHTEINQQVVYHGDGKEVFIKRGTPLVQYVPFKRTKYDLEVREAREDDKEKDDIVALTRISKLFGSGAYKAMHKKNEKKDV